MDIMELGAIGELVGGLAVIGSLIYVGIQVRQNTRTLPKQAEDRHRSRTSKQSAPLPSMPTSLLMASIAWTN